MSAADYNSHGTKFNRIFGPGIVPMISKNSGPARYSIAPNGLTQSNVGVKINEPIAGDWSFVGRAEIGFDPYTLQLANSPGSLVQNNAYFLPNQSGSGDGSRAGQILQLQVYAGLSNKTFGTLTFGRENSLTLDGVNAYDPMGGSYAFSVIGYSGTTAGVGDTEDARNNSALKYTSPSDSSAPARWRSSAAMSKATPQRPNTKVRSAPTSAACPSMASTAM